MIRIKLNILLVVQHSSGFFMSVPCDGLLTSSWCIPASYPITAGVLSSTSCILKRTNQLKMNEIHGQLRDSVA